MRSSVGRVEALYDDDDKQWSAWRVCASALVVLTWLLGVWMRVGGGE